MKTLILIFQFLFASLLSHAICVVNFTPIIESDNGLVYFENTSTPNMQGNGIDENILYIWDFGDGTIDTTYYTSSYGIHTYLQEGTYEVCLTEYYYVWGNFNCTASLCQTINVDISSFGCDAGETPLEVTITACCNLEPLQFISYNIYSGTQILPENFVYYGEIYLEPQPGQETNLHCLTPGCYLISFNFVKLFETPENLDIYLTGNFSEDYQILETTQGYPSLISFCIIDEVEICPNEIIISDELDCHQFVFSVNNWGENQFGDINWSFGDNNEGYGMNDFLHMYSNPGSYTVCTWGTTETCPDGFQICTAIDVEACGGNTEGCPEFIWSNMINDCGLWHFEAGIPTTNENATIIWDFGDGTSTTDFNTLAEHQYTADGVYTVTVNIQLYGNDCAPTIFLETTITVNACEINLCDIDIFSLAGDSCGVMIFEAGSFVEGEAFIWYFGDGTTEEGGHYIEHTYAEPGIYNVNCVFSNALCQGWQESTTITVDDCETTCSDVFVTLYSYVTSGGPEVAYWSISTMNMEPYANGVIEFTNQNPYIDFAYCIEDGCYMLTLEGLGVGMTELFEPGVQMNGLSVVQDVNIINDNLIEIVFGVNSECVDGIEDISTPEISIYPNPASNLLSVYHTKGERIEGMELWDGAGRLILTKPFSNQLDVSQIAEGTYFVRVIWADRTKVLPLQIHH